MAGSRDHRPACAAPRQQTAPGPRMPARAPCTPWGRRALRAGRRRPAAHRRPFTPGRAPRQQEAHREYNLCSPAGRIGNLTRGWCRRAASGAAAPARARARATGAGRAAAGRQRMVPARPAAHSHPRGGPHPNTAGPEPSRCTRRRAPPAALLILGFSPGFRLSGTVCSNKQGVLNAFRLLHVRHHKRTHTGLFACTRRAVLGRRGCRTPMRRTRSSAQRAEPGACAIANSLASVESSALAAGGAILHAPRHSSTSTACPTACARAR